MKRRLTGLLLGMIIYLLFAVIFYSLFIGLLFLLYKLARTVV